MSRHLTRAVPRRLQELLVDQTHPFFKHGRVHAGSGRDPGHGRVVRKQDWHEGVNEERSTGEAFAVRAVKQFHHNLSAMQTTNLAATSGYASNDKRSADISSLDHLRIKSLWPSIIRWRMNDT
jgi:hypothetical protein